MSYKFILSTEHELAESYQTVIQHFWQNQMLHDHFSGENEVNIAYAYVIHPEAIGSVVISSGRIESMVKYKEVVFDLFQNGYSVFIHDHRGQGLSGRMLENAHMGYVQNFDDYITDFKTFMDEVVKKHSQHKAKLLCHSMGGAIGALMILRHPELFEKVAFSAPMFGIRPSLPNWLSHSLLGLHGLLNKQVAYFFGQKDYESTLFADNDLSQSEIRYQIFRQEYQDNPTLQLGGVTGHWLKEAIKAMDEIEKNAHLFPVPALVIQAGADTVVDNNRQKKVATEMANTKFMLVDGARHELLEEQDQYRVKSMNAVLEFFAK